MPHIFGLHELVGAQHAAVQELKQKFGIREIPRLGKLTKQDGSADSGIFGKPLSHLPCDSVPIIVKYREDGVNVSTDVSVEVPSYVIQCCHLIQASPNVVGLFRKAGSSARQKDIKKQVESGIEVGDQHHVIDICNVLKQFLRDLPDPLIPTSLHELFVKCSQSEDPVTALQLCCFLLPVTHLSTLCFLMQFLSTIASHSGENLMDELNLSTILAPTLMPLPEQKNDKCSGAVYTAKMQARAKVLELMIRNSEVLCAIPECLATKVRLNSSDSENMILLDDDESRGRRTKVKREKRKKRRSGSFTRMIDGLRKMVTRSTGPSPAVSIEALDDVDPMATPAKDWRNVGKPSPMIKSSKRKADGEPSANTFSSKKKKAILENLPQASVLATTPFTPQGQHVAQPGQSEYPFSSPPISLDPSSACKPVLTEAKKHKRFFTPKRQNKKAEAAEGKGPLVVESKTPKLNKRRLSLGRRSGKKSLDKVLDGADETYDTNCFNIQGKRQRSTRKRTQSGPSTYGRQHKTAITTSATNLDANDNPLRPTVSSDDVSRATDTKSKPNQSDRTLSATSDEQPVSTSSNAIVRTPSVVGCPAPSRVTISSKQSNNDAEEQYQELRTRLDAMEVELSNQLNQIQMSGKLDDSRVDSPLAPLEAVLPDSDTPRLVQGAYEKTLESSEKLAENINASDQLAKELKRGLKIRRSAEHRVIRSPSARKIGVLRRRSRESPRQHAGPSPRLRRCQSAQLRAVGSPMSATTPLLGLQADRSYIRQALRRGRPNTVGSGLPTPSPMRVLDAQEDVVPSSGSQPVTSQQTPQRKMSTRSEKRQSLEPPVVTLDSASQDSNVTKPQAKIQRNGSVLKLVKTFESGSQIGPVRESRKSASAADLKLPMTSLQPSVALRRESFSAVKLEASAQPPPIPPRTYVPSHLKSSPAHRIEPVPEIAVDDNEWVSADIFVRHLAHLEGPTNGRPSLQKLRTENTGKVIQCVKKFDKSEVKTIARAPSTLRGTKSRLSLAPASKLLPEASASPIHDLATVLPNFGQKRRWVSGNSSSEVGNKVATPPEDVSVDKKYLRVSLSPLRDSNKVNIVATPAEALNTAKLEVATPLLTTPRLKSALMNAPRGLTPAYTPRGFKARMHAEGRVGKRASPLRAVASVTSPRRSPRLHYLQTESPSSASKNRVKKSPSDPVY